MIRDALCSSGRALHLCESVVLFTERTGMTSNEWRMSLTKP
jgi:hypothetical protein